MYSVKIGHKINLKRDLNFSIRVKNYVVLHPNLWKRK